MLTPLAFDPGRPFPHISNLSLNLAVVIRDANGVEHFARIKVPDSLPQLVPVTAASPKRKLRRPGKRIALVWLEQVIAANLAALFPGMEVVEAIRSTSPATPRWPSRNWRRRTCSRPSKRACASGGSAASCG